MFLCIFYKRIGPNSISLPPKAYFNQSFGSSYLLRYFKREKMVRIKTHMSNLVQGIFNISFEFFQTIQESILMTYTPLIHLHSFT